MERNIISNNKKTLFKFLRYIFMIFVITSGLISIIATGGGRGGGDIEETTNSPANAPSISNLDYNFGCG